MNQYPLVAKEIIMHGVINNNDVINVITFLIKDSKPDSQFEDKEWTFVIEDVSCYTNSHAHFKYKFSSQGSVPQTPRDKPHHFVFVHFTCKV